MKFNIQEHQKWQNELSFEDPVLQELLTKMLSFNPDLRWSAIDCLNSSYFNSVRKPELEIDAPWKIKLAIDQDDSFDYEKSVSTLYD